MDLYVQFQTQAAHTFTIWEERFMIEVLSEITDVCVYLKGAYVTRTARVQSTNNKYIFKNLPCRFNDESLQFEVSGQAYVQNVSIDLVPVKSGEHSAELNELRDELFYLNSKESSLQELLDMVVCLTPQEEVKGKTDFAKLANSLNELSEFKEEQIKEINDELFTLKKQGNSLKSKIKEIKKNQQSKISCNKNVSFELVSSVDEVDVKIRYLVTDATWSPSYSVNVNSLYSSGSLKMNAMVAQNSGEDWKGINISLSTAKPYKFSKLPELKSLFIGRRQQDAARSSFRPAPADTEGLFYDFDVFNGAPVKHDSPKHKIQKREVDCSSRLIVLSEIMRGYSLDIETSPLLIGSGDSADLEINDPTVSYDHAKIDYINGRLYISDLESTNGTRINGEVIYADTEIKSGDIIQVGGIEILHDNEDPSSKASNTTQTSICFELDEPALMRNVSPVKASAPAASRNRSGFSRSSESTSRNKSSVKLKRKSVGSISDVDSMLGDVGGYDERLISYEESPADSLNKHSALYLDTQKEEKRGKLNWKSNLEIYRMQLQKIGYTGELHEIINLLTDKEIKVNPLPSVVSDLSKFDYSFRGSFSVNVPSGKHHYLIPLQEAQVEFELSYLCIPRESKAFYRSLDIKNPFSTPLLSGPLDIYLEKKFINTGELGSAPSGGYINLILGEEQNIKLVRRTFFNEESHGLMNGKNLLKHKIVNEVTNRTGKEIKVELRERLPYAHKKAEKQVKIALTESKPEWQALPKDKSFDIDRQIHFWKAQINNDESQEFEFSYDIELASKEEVVGGNRREF